MNTLETHDLVAKQEQDAPQVGWRDAQYVAQFLGISIQHVYYLTDIGELIGIQMGRRRLWMQEDLDNYVAELRKKAVAVAAEKRRLHQLDLARKKSERDPT